MSTLMEKSEYARMYKTEETLWWYVGLRDLLKMYVAKYPKDTRILDVGCGTGKNLEFLNSLGYQNAVGIEYSETGLEFCALRQVNAQKGTITDLNFPNESFDVVYCFDVLYILNEKERDIAVKELVRVLRPGGILLVHSAALELLRSQHDIVVNTKKRFTKKEHEQEFAKYNLEILRSSYRVFCLFPLILIFKLWKKITSSTKSAQSDQTQFPKPINFMLTQIQLLENKLLKLISLPIGSSVFIALKKK